MVSAQLHQAGGQEPAAAAQDQPALQVNIVHYATHITHISSDLKSVLPLV